MRNCWLATIAGHQGNAPIEARGADGRSSRRGRLAGRPRRSPGPAAGPGAQKTRGSTSNNQRHTATRSVLYPRLEAPPGPSGLAAASNRAAHAAPFHCLARHLHHMWHKTRTVRAQQPSLSHISRVVAARASSVQRSTRGSPVRDDRTRENTQSRAQNARDDVLFYHVYTRES